MDDTLGDTQYTIHGNYHNLCCSHHPYFLLASDHETAIMYRLQEVVLEQTSSLLAVLEISAELDW